MIAQRSLSYESLLVSNCVEKKSIKRRYNAFLKGVIRRKRSYNAKWKGVIITPLMPKRRNNAFPKGVIMPFIKYFHAQHLLKLTLRTLAIITTANLIYISTAYLAQTFDLYLRVLTRLHWIWKGVGVRKNRESFQLFNGYFMFIFYFFSVEPIHKSIYVLHVNRTYFICTYMTLRVFSGFQIAKINNIYNSFL